MAHAVREVGGELLHLADGVPLVVLHQHGVILAHHLVAVLLGRLVVRAGGQILLDLPEDPRIRAGRAADHDGVAVRSPAPCGRRPRA